MTGDKNIANIANILGFKTVVGSKLARSGRKIKKLDENYNIKTKNREKLFMELKT